MMQRSRLKVEEKEFDFEFEVVSVQFNQLGRYVLIVTVENPLLDDSGEGVQLRLDDGDILKTNSGCTEAMKQTSLDEVCTCMNSRFVFTLPKGFCKNNKNHDVRLKVEALRVRDSERRDGTKAGEDFFAIYPCTSAPRINLYVDQGEELYQNSGVMALPRVHNDYLSMHCGRLVYTVCFHEARPFLKNISSSSYGPLLSEGYWDVISEGETPTGPTALQVPTPILGSLPLQGSVMVSQEYYTPRSTELGSIPSLQPGHQTQSEQLPVTDTKVDISPESLPFMPRVEEPQIQT